MKYYLFGPFTAKISVTSSIVINLPTREAGETKRLCYVTVNKKYKKLVKEGQCKIKLRTIKDDIK